MFSKKGVFHPNGLPAGTSKQFSIFRGLILAVLSGASFSIVSVIVKQMRNLHPGQLALYRFLSMLVMTLPETVKSGENPFGPSNFRLLLLLRGLFGGFFDFLSFISFQYLGLGEASVIIFSSPVVVTIFARICFNEPCNIFQTITVILTVLGIIFTTKLPSHFTDVPVVYSNEKIYGLLAAIISLFSISGLQLLTRKIRSVHQAVINFNYGLTGVVEMAFLTATFGNFKWQQCGIQSMYILVLAIFSYCGLTLMVKALQCECAGPVSTVRASADIGMAFMWQIFIFHDVPDVYGIIGAILVLVSIILVSLGKWLTSLESNSSSSVKSKSP